MRHRWFGTRGWWLWWLVVLAALCGADVQRVGSGHRGDVATSRKEAAMPAGLRAAYVGAVQAEAGASYKVKQGVAGLVAENPAQGIAMGFSSDGVSLEANGARATLQPVRFGCEGGLREVEKAAPELRAGRVEYRRKGFVEWYVNGPLGVEQGFSVTEAPGCGDMRSGELRVELALGQGMSAKLGADGEQVELRDAEGEQVLGYSELYAMDATGKPLAARLGVTGEGVSIRVETAGAVYPVVIDPLIWKEQSKLLAGDGGAGNSFGNFVAIDGNTALIVAHLDDTTAQDAGAVYVFVRDGTSWIQQQKILASDGTAGDRLGIGIAISGETAIIGARYDDDGGPDAGSVYVFTRSGHIWTQRQKIFPSDGRALDQFGQSVAINGDTVVIGTLQADDKVQRAGAIYVFVRAGSTWVQQQKILIDNATTDNDLGRSVAISDDTLVAGAASYTTNGSGAAYIFSRTSSGGSGATWTMQQKLIADTTSAGDEFGQSVAISGNTIIVGAFRDDVNGQDSGSAYVFVRSGATWSLQQKLLPSDGSAQAGFGLSVALLGNKAIIGATGNDADGRPVVTAYVFVRSGSTWSEQQKLFVSHTDISDIYGVAVALSGDTAVVGARNNDDTGHEPGSTSIFRLGLSTGDACSTDTDCADILCFGGSCVDAVSSCTNAVSGTPCEDGSPCTHDDTCQGGICLGQAFSLCPAPPAAEVCSRAFCFPATASCGVTSKLDGAPCPDGICIAGGCFVDTPLSSSSNVSTGNSGSAGSTGSTSTGPSSSMTSTSISSGAGGAGGTNAGGAPAEPAEIHLRGGACAYSTAPGRATALSTFLAPLLLAARRILRRKGRSREQG